MNVTGDSPVVMWGEFLLGSWRSLLISQLILEIAPFILLIHWLQDGMYHFLMLLHAEKNLKSSDVNAGALSETNNSGIRYLANIVIKISMVVVTVALNVGIASTHFECASTATKYIDPERDLHNPHVLSARAYQGCSGAFGGFG